MATRGNTTDPSESDEHVTGDEPGKPGDQGGAGRHPRSVQGEKAVSQEQAARIKQRAPDDLADSK